MKTPRPAKDPNSWDIIIFTQTWPNTLCYSWKISNPAHTCNLPSDKNIWTVHGIWFVYFLFLIFSVREIMILYFYDGKSSNDTSPNAIL